MKRLILLLSVLATVYSSRLSAQATDSSHYWVVSTWKIQFSDLEDYMKIMKEYFLPVYKEMDFVLSFKLYSHSYGPDWTVLTISEFANFEDIGKVQKNFERIFAKHVPDKEKREEIMMKVRAYIKGHDDAIVTDNPEISK